MTAQAAPAVLAGHGRDLFMGRPISPLTRRRLDAFRANRRGFWSLWIFLVLFTASLFAEFIANDRPIVVHFDGGWYFPVFHSYPETAFGGVFPTAADYRDPEVSKLIDAKGWMVWPLIPFSYNTINYNLPSPAPSPPSRVNWLGTDDQGRDVLARLIYGFRISVLFGLTLTAASSVIGVAAGAVQGYFGGVIDLGFQRFMEIWSGLAGFVSADHHGEFYRTEFLAAAGLDAAVLMDGPGRCCPRRVSASAQFRLCASSARARRARPHNHLAACPAKRDGGHDHIFAVHFERLDHDADIARFSGLRIAARLGFARRIVGPGKVQSAGAVAWPTAFFVLALMLSLLIFVGEAVRDAFDPRKVTV